MRDIQKEILGKLINTNGLKYTDARPARVENDLFNYHLQFLVGKGLITKNDDGLYSLSTEGKKYVDGFISTSQEGKPYFRFRVAVLVCPIKIENGVEYVLNQTRKRHPFFGDTGLLTGKVRAAEPMIETVNRKLFDEAGLRGDATINGSIRKIRYDHQGELFSDSLWYFCIVRNILGNLKENYRFGDNHWNNWDETIKFEEESVQGSKNIASIYKQLRDNPSETISFFHFEEIVKLPKF